MLTQFLNNKGHYAFEGNCSEVQGQLYDLKKITENVNIKNIFEIGFNAGHSADLFLSNNKNIMLTSFDLGNHNYVSTAKEYVDLTYPGRHLLILGDSAVTIPQYINTQPAIKYDVIFIDGGHDYLVAKSDVENCSKLAHKDTIVILDDTMFTKGGEASWTAGPTQVWTEYINQNKIIEIDHKDYCPGRGMSWGKYVLD